MQSRFNPLSQEMSDPGKVFVCPGNDQYLVTTLSESLGACRSRCERGAVRSKTEIALRGKGILHVSEFVEEGELKDWLSITLKRGL